MIGAKYHDRTTRPMNSLILHLRCILVLLLLVVATPLVWAQGSQTVQTLRLIHPNAPTNGISLIPPTGITAYSLTLPASQGASNQVLINDGNGTLSWAAMVSGWSLTGNGSTNASTNFIGTTDATDLVFRTGNTERMRIVNTSGQLSTSNDALINGVRVGRGGNADASNTALGSEALLVNTSGANSTAIGFRTLYSATTGTNNTAVGFQALTSNTTGSQNVGIGTSALQSNTAGLYNTAVGVSAGTGLTGSSNTAIGWGALNAANSGTGNVALGFEAGYNATGSDKLYISNTQFSNLILGDFATGRIAINGGSSGSPTLPDATLQVNVRNATTVGLIVKASTSPTANLFEAQNSAGGILLNVGPSGAVTLNPFGTSAGNTNELRFAELVANGSNYVGFKGPDAIGSNRIWTLPSADGTNGQVLSTNGSGILSWVTPSTGWSLTGNAGTSPAPALGSTASSGNFIGTTTGVSLSFVTNNIVRMRIDQDGNPSTQLDMTINNVAVGKGGGSVARNVRVGNGALNATATGNDNTAVGNNVLSSNVSGGGNSALGSDALRSNTSGNQNTAMGWEALESNTTGGGNVAIGAQSLDASNTSFNVAIGHSALGAQNGGNGSNTAVGAAAMLSNLTGENNAAFGMNALRELTSGNNNVAMGFQAGTRLQDNTTALTVASSSIFIGSNARSNADSETNQIVIGSTATGLGSNTVVLGNSSIVTTALRGNVGIGTTAPATQLHATNTSATTNAVVDVLRLDVQSSGTPAVGIGTGLEFATETAANNTEIGSIIESVSTDIAAGTEDFDLVFRTMAGGAAAAERMRIASTGNVTIQGDVTASGFFESSDMRLKEVLRRDGDVAYFRWKDGRDTSIHIGYLAQEVQTTHPDQVKADKDGMLSVNYIEMLVEKIRQLEKRIEELESRK